MKVEKIIRVGGSTYNPPRKNNSKKNSKKRKKYLTTEVEFDIIINVEISKIKERLGVNYDKRV